MPVKFDRNLRLDTALVWALRVLVGCLPFIGAEVSALWDGQSTSTQTTGTCLAWLVWGAIVIASFVTHPITLTLLRIGTPVVSSFLIVVAATQGASSLQIISAAVGIAILLLSFSAELGGVYVQASAYGDEKRFALRPPVVLVAPVVIATLVVDVSIISAPLLLAENNWLAAASALFGSIISVKYLIPRIHKLSRRWLVFVPAGLVVHDEIVLSMNLLIKKQDLNQMQLARDNSSAADLSALTWGVPLELSFNKPLDVSLSAIGARHLKAVSAIHAQSVLIAASRPGAVLRAK